MWWWWLNILPRDSATTPRPAHYMREANVNQPTYFIHIPLGCVRSRVHEVTSLPPKYTLQTGDLSSGFESPCRNEPAKRTRARTRTGQMDAVSTVIRLSACYHAKQIGTVRSPYRCSSDWAVCLYAPRAGTYWPRTNSPSEAVCRAVQTVVAKTSLLYNPKAVLRSRMQKPPPSNQNHRFPSNLFPPSSQLLFPFPHPWLTGCYSSPGIKMQCCASHVILQ